MDASSHDGLKEKIYKSLSVVMRGVKVSTFVAITIAIVRNISPDERSGYHFILSTYVGFLIFFAFSCIGVHSRSRESGADIYVVTIISFFLFSFVCLLGRHLIFEDAFSRSIFLSLLYSISVPIFVALGILMTHFFGDTEGEK